MLRRPWLAALLLCALLALALQAPAVASQAPRDQAPLPGYDYPLGHFFPAGQDPDPASGFGVDDGAGVPFWSEYQRLGGMGVLGLPLSRRFTWKEWTVQHFQGGTLRWLAVQGQADIVADSDVGNPPGAAVVLEPPAIQEGGMDAPAWSGWWWPASDRVRPPHLYDDDSPLQKYDAYVTWRSGSDPGTLAWERSHYLLADGPTWAGHCNGWAAAAVVEPQPTAEVQAGPISFGVSDLKALLADYHFADSATWLYGGDDSALNPLDFHRELVDWLIEGHRGFVLVFHPGGEEIWSYPAYRARVVYAPDAERAGVTHVTATVWMADNMVPPDFVGTRNYPSDDGEEFDYVLTGPRDNPDSADWEGPSVGGGFAQPWQIWYPEPRYRNVHRELTSPNLDYGALMEILGRAAPAQPQQAPSPEAPAATPAPGAPPATPAPATPGASAAVAAPSGEAATPSEGAALAATPGADATPAAAAVTPAAPAAAPAG